MLEKLGHPLCGSRASTVCPRCRLLTIASSANQCPQELQYKLIYVAWIIPKLHRGVACLALFA
jgi:hypothetical protein